MGGNISEDRPFGGKELQAMQAQSRPEQARVDTGGLVRVMLGATMISFSAVLVKLTTIDATTITFYRVFFGGVFLAIVALLRRESFRGSAKLYGFLLLCGVIFALDLECWHRSISYIGPGLATILANFQVFFLALAGILLFKEPSSWRLWLAIPSAIVGLWLLLGIDASALPPGAMTGVALALATALWYASYLLMLRQSQRQLLRLKPVTNMALVSLATALVVGAATLFRGEAGLLAPPVGRDLLIMLTYGVGPQALGWLLISTGLPRLSASLAGLTILLQPTLSFTWDILFFHRPTGPLGVLGATLAIGAIYMGLTGGRGKKNA